MFLGTVFLAWAGTFAWMVGRRAAVQSPIDPATRGAELFERHCASCHSLDDMRAAAGTPADASRREEIAQFLDGHSDATADENRQILDVLAPGHTP